MKKILLLLVITFCFNVNAQIISTMAGKGTAAYSGDGGQAINAELYIGCINRTNGFVIIS